MLKVLFAAPPQKWSQYRTALHDAFARADLSVELGTAHAPETVDYIVYAPGGDLEDFTPYVNCKAVLCLWAGVEGIVGNATLTQPLTRMVDTGLERGMVEWVTAHVLRHHIGLDAHIAGQDGVWRNGIIPKLARDRKVTVLGLGALGSACASTLAQLEFDVTGWSRGPRSVLGVRGLHGAEMLDEALDGAEIVVLLLPLTAETENLLTAERLARLAPGAVVINPGRGGLIDDDALLAALDSGAVGHATLDTFRVEPLDPAHPYWAHPRVTVTPHIASETRAATAAEIIADNIRRCESGAPMRFLVDRARGY